MKETMGMMIANKRKELNMTQAELAEKMGVTDKAVSKWERDLSFPDVSSLPKLAEVFGLSVDELMQIKTETVQKGEPSFSEVVPLIFKAICLAMGVAVAVLSIIGALEVENAITMLGVGLICAGLSFFEKKQ